MGTVIWQNQHRSWKARDLCRDSSIHNRKLLISGASVAPKSIQNPRSVPASVPTKCRCRNRLEYGRGLGTVPSPLLPHSRRDPFPTSLPACNRVPDLTSASRPSAVSYRYPNPVSAPPGAAKVRLHRVRTPSLLGPRIAETRATANPRGMTGSLSTSFRTTSFRTLPCVCW